MAQGDNRLLLLMVHGVSSTLEWSSTVLSVLGSHFQTRLIRYRYFHTIWGPVKVYVWPTALLLLVGCALAKWAHSSTDDSLGKPTAFWLVIGLLVLQFLIAAFGEIQWMRRVEKSRPVFLPPLFLTAIGLMGAFSLGYPWQWACPIASTVGTAVFLDLREYGGSRFGTPALLGLPTLVTLVSGWFISIFLAGVDVKLAFFALGVVAVTEPILRANLAFERVKAELQAAADDSPFPPFLVAHSLGTYLTAHVLRETQSLNLSRIIYTGCVLDRRFRWDEIVPSSGESRLMQVTNYVGRIDLVPAMTGLLRCIWCLSTVIGRIVPDRVAEVLRNLLYWRSLGAAGVLGFKGSSELVHTTKPQEPCSACSGKVGLIHNIDHGWARHSTLNQDRPFQAWSWIPSLWGIPVHEYHQWQSICRRGYAHSQNLKESINWVSLREYEDKLLKGPWSWPSSPDVHGRPGQTLEQLVESLLKAQSLPVQAKQLMKRLPTFLFSTVHEAFQEARKKADDQDSVKMGWLHPEVALQRAVLLAQEVQK